MSSTGGSPDLPSRMPTAQATPTPPITNEAQNIPIQMAPTIPHLFANPFMSPFMPQQSMDPQGGPFPGQNGAQFPQQGMFFSPAQYQEMMQQYFQQMMMASQQYAAGQMAFPMPFQQFSHSATRPESQASMTDSLSEAATNGIRNVYINDTPSHHEIPTATVAPIVPQSSSSISSEEEKSPEKNSNQHINIEESCHAEVHEKIIEDGATPSTAENEKQKVEEIDGSSSDDRKASVSDDEKTSSLIKKQMSEIEKEIIRRSQNKNIKQIDDREMADLIGPTAAEIESEFGPNYSAAKTDQMGLPYTPPAPEAKTQAPKETLNQLRSSFNLPENGPATAVAAPDFTNILPNQQTQPQSQFSVGFPGMGAPLPPVAPIPSQMGPHFINPFAQSQPYSQYPAVQNTQQFTPEQMAEAFLANTNIGQMIPNNFGVQPTAVPQQHQSTVPFQQYETTVPQGFPPGTSGHPGLAPPPAPSHPVNRPKANTAQQHMPVIDQSSSSDWPDENKENGDEPVWVLRESYLKRMQRDSNANEQQQASDWVADPSPVSELPLEEEEETDRLISTDSNYPQHQQAKKKNSKETMVHEPAVLIEGVLFRAKYLGSTQMICETRSSKAARMNQAQEAVARVKAPQGEIQPSTEIDLFISTEKIMVLNTDLQRISDTDVRQDILMDHALRTISYIADIGDLVVLMARRMTASDSEDSCDRIDGVKRAPKVICHVFESEEASFIAQSIGQAFQVAYVEFLRANGIDDPSYLRQIDYQEVLNSQELMGDELEMFARKETQKDVVVPKKSGEALGIVVVESGWGSMLPTVVLAHMNPNGPAARSNQLNIGDQIININGISLVGLPLSAAQNNIKNVKTATAVRLTVVSTPPVVEVRIRRPDTKYQLGFSVQNGVICSLLRGGIAERGGIRVGHRIIEINGHSVVAVAHDRIVNMLATAIGEIHMKTMPTSMFRLLTGQEVPQYI